MTRTRLEKTVALAVLLASLSAIVGRVGAFGALAVDDAKTSAASRQPSATEAGPAERVADRAAVAMKKITVRGVCVDQHSTPLFEVRVRIFRYPSRIDAPVLIADLRTDTKGEFIARDVETVVDRSPLGGMGDLFVAATADRRVSAIKRIDREEDDVELKLVLSDDAGTLSGRVTDAAGRPLRGATVCLPGAYQQPLPDVQSAVTDEDGHYEINDLKRWKAGDTAGPNRVMASANFLVHHPDYPLTRATNAAVPQTVNVTLLPAAVAEGTVIDAVTNRPLANVIVSAQGVARSGWLQTRTDAQGRYRLNLAKDHYNIWADAEDRIAIAVKALAVEPGKTVSGADIKLVRGAFVTGTVIDAATNEPVVPAGDRAPRVAHYGPARPRTGAAVTSTKVHPDGTYRLRVAPGTNSIYLMTGGSSEIVTVADGEEIMVDLIAGQRVAGGPRRAAKPAGDFAADLELAAKLRRQAEEEDVRKGGVTVSRKASRLPPKLPARQRRDTPVGRLLNKLGAQNSSNALFKDEWCRTLKEIVELGPAAVPELIDELDATRDDRMLRCLGFTLRAIGDKRAVPGLIRAIPKRLLPPGSDMGLRSDDAELVRFMQQHDLNPQDRDMHFNFGRPVREIFGALQALTGRKEDEEQLFHVFLNGVASQQRMKRELFQRTAEKWAAWWNEHWKELIDDGGYARVNLPELAAAEAVEPPPPGAHFKTEGGSSGWILQSVLDAEAKHVFYDLDTGRAASLPDKWRKAANIEAELDAIVAWAKSEGFDLMGVEYTPPGGEQRVFALRSIGLRAWQLGKERLKRQTDDLTLEALQAEGTPAGDLLLYYDQQTKQFDPKATASFFYVTRDGSPGLLFVGVEVLDTRVVLGVPVSGDSELNPVGFFKGRRFGYNNFVEATPAAGLRE